MEQARRGQRNGFGNAMSGMRNCKNRYRAISICIDYHTDSKDCKTDMLFIAYYRFCIAITFIFSKYANVPYSIFKNSFRNANFLFLLLNVLNLDKYNFA